ncbi:GNAT family N-acetyltransferase [Bythopirellula goksoeyrii]|uniref:Putative N-acetyltransferase YafP n=1 Tax=Bythopirellula goksoeyrii TaxID=1400387 RepID=A0A5B9QBG5_9BACT|nr:GNAT family N-acetyltransferase [Bythopirellula goksoeyrii]QEG34852.1 putative N-acetyltransferase YafP [Bythopirellula goksoeyrii]
MLVLRHYNPNDAVALFDLFLHTVREINSADYDPVQISAWASEEIEFQQWQQRFVGRFAYVAYLDDQIVGFADMTTEGYLDRLFVSSQHQRQGIAKALLAKLKADASESSLSEIITEASITAKPFFEASGFVNVRAQTVELRGVEFLNYRMAIRVQ